MNRYTVAVLVRNQFGVLNRVTSMFRRRQFNIASLSVSETETAEFSRITVQFEGEENSKQQLINQLYKLPDVCSIKDLSNQNSITTELLLIKVENKSDTRDEILAAAAAFGAKTVDYCKDSVVFQLTSDPLSIDSFINLMRDFNIVEICRTGVISLQRGYSALRSVTNY